MTEPAGHSTQISLSIATAVLKQIDAIAAATERSREQAITDAITLLVAEHEERVSGEAAATGSDSEKPGGASYFSGG